jgi:hypothetical protein
VDAPHSTRVPIAEWRRFQRRVGAQHSEQQRGIGTLEGGNVTLEELTRSRVGRLQQCFGLELEFIELSVGALQATFDGRFSSAQELRSFSCGKGQHLPEDEDGTLTCWQVL